MIIENVNTSEHNSSAEIIEAQVDDNNIHLQQKQLRTLNRRMVIHRKNKS